MLGKYDTDIYIVDPIAHYCYLEHLERHIVARSENFRCAGKYDLEDNLLREVLSLPGDFGSVSTLMLR